MQATGLKRVLGRLDALFLGFGAMIGWGWIILAGLAVAQGGVVGAGLAFLLGSIVITVIGITYAELASAMPYAGGEHVYTERAFGPTLSFVCTWSIIFGYISVVAFEAIALPVAVVYLFPELKIYPLWMVAGYQVHASEVVIGAAMAAFITLLNIAGIRLAAKVQAAALIPIFGAGLVLILGGVVNIQSIPTDLEVWTGWAGFFSVIILVPFLFVGFDAIPQSAEEMDIPRRQIGLALVRSILMAAVFYLCIVFAAGLAPIDSSEVVLATADAAGAYWESDWVAGFVVLAGIGGIITSWNAFLIGGSRALFAMARSGQLPSALAAVHERFATPWVAILLIGIVSIFAPLLGRNALVWIVNAGGFCIVIAYIFVAAAFLTLRIKEPEMERPYRAPFGMATGVVALVLGLALVSLYLPWSPSKLNWPHEWGLVAGWYLIGAVMFVIALVSAGKRGKHQ